MTTPTAADVVFDEEAHIYSLGFEVLPSVTQVLGPIYDLSSAPAYMVEYKAALGSAVHRACELWDTGNLGDIGDERITPYLSAWQQFVADFAPEWTAIEKVVFHSQQRYAGKIDRLAVVNGEQWWLIDLKTSSALHPSTAVQLAGYQWALQSEVSGLRRVAVHLKPNGRYHVAHYNNDEADRETFAALLNIWRWKQQNGLGGSR